MRKALRLSYLSSNRQHATLFIIILLLACSALLSRSSASGSKAGPGDLAARTGEMPARQRRQFGKTNDHERCAAPDAHEIYIPLTELPEAQGGELVFNSRSPKEMEVTPIFYKLDGTRVVGNPVVIKAAEIRYVDFRKLLPPGHRDEHGWGGLSLAYLGVPREMWAQFRLLGINGGGNVDEFFNVKAEQRSEIQEAVWWAPPKSASVIALGNITDAPTSATVTFSGGEPQAVNLAPHATEMLRRRSGRGDSLESVVINVNGAPGSIVPTGLIASKDGSFNSVIRFYDTKSARQPNLFANGLRLGGVTPHMILKNTSPTTVTATPKLIASGEHASVEPVTLPDVRLGPRQMAEVDLSPLSAAGRNDLDVVSVQVANSGEPGSLIGAVYGTDNRAGINYETPLRDSGPVRSMTGSYPWNIEKDFKTVVYITNISDQEAGFAGEINYQGGNLILDPRTLQPGETAVFDLQKIRDTQAHDNAGRKLPKKVTLGQFKWAVRGLTNGKLLLIGRVEMVSRSQRISTSYSCNDPCPPTYDGWLDPFPPGVVYVGRTGSSSAWEQMYYSWGTSVGPYAVSASWSWDAAVGSVSPASGTSTTLTGGTPGTGDFLGLTGPYQDYGWDGLNCYEYSSYYGGGGGPIDVACAVPTNFHQTSASDAGGGTLHFDYAWDSSSGNLADLSQCTVGEKVDYNSSDLPFPSPPFPSGLSPTNPTILNVPGDDGVAQDNHSTPGTFVKPYQAASVVASQVYRYSCPCHNSGAFETLLGPHNITRTVSQNTNGSWKFTITKTGSSATINPLP